jgi:hypothetical protein
MHEADIQLRQRELKLFPCRFCRLRFQQIGLFNQGTDPVGLAPFLSTGVANPINNIVATGIGMATVVTGVRPGGSSSITEVSRSA